MSTTPGSGPSRRLPTGEVLARMRELLAAVDHDVRGGLDAEARLALVTDAVAVGRQVEALRAVLVGEADRARAAEGVRGASLRSVLATSAQVTAGEASGWVHAGRQVTGRRGVRNAALAGEVSVVQARAIDKVLGELPATLSDDQRDRAETILLAKARKMDAKGLADQTRHVLTDVAPEVDAVADELTRLEEQRQQAWASRSFVITPDGRGSMVFKGSLPLLEGEAFSRLVAGYTESNRRATERSADRHDEGLRTFAQRNADGLIALVNAHSRGAYPAGRGAARGERRVETRTRPPATTVVVTMGLEALLTRGEQAGLLPDGRRLSAGELRRALCDCRVVPVVLGAASEPLDMGRSRRLVRPEIRRALEVRDGGCAFPGCEVPPHACEAHHIIPWWASGPTALANLVMLCPYHHRVVEPLRFWSDAEPATRWRVRMATDGLPEFLPPAGAVVGTAARHQRRGGPGDRAGPPPRGDP